jgi:hypothetical protein
MIKTIREHRKLPFQVYQDFSKTDQMEGILKKSENDCKNPDPAFD